MIGSNVKSIINNRFQPEHQGLRLSGIYFRIAGYTMAIFGLMLFTCQRLSAQKQILHYDVIFKGDVIGNMRHYQNKSVENTYLKMVSKAQLRFMMSLQVYTEEESIFKGGKLMYSSISRKVNGKERINKQTRAAGEGYQTSSEGKAGIVNKKSIDYSLIMLYNHEPVNIPRVYADNFQQFLLIRKVEDHKYYIEFPDGNFNYYSYKDGLCSRVEVHSSIYNFQMQLRDVTGWQENLN